jgi:hypothetical protein
MLGWVLAVGCGITKPRNDGAPKDAPSMDEGDTPPESDTASEGPTDGVDTPSASDSALDGLEKADSDGPGCPTYPGDAPGLVCFGTDPAPYQLYLLPKDGGYAAGQCPTPDDFGMTVGEGGCVYLGCGPVQVSAAASSTDAGDRRCCYWVRRVCGV